MDKSPTLDQTLRLEEPQPDPPQNDSLNSNTYPTSDIGRGVVGWDGIDDPENPRNFKSSRKWVLLSLVSMCTFISSLASSVNAPGVPAIDAEFDNHSGILSSLVVSVFLLGLSIGPLLLSSLSEIYGRQPVLNISNAVITLWQIGCALSPNINSLIIFRLLAGFWGSASLTVGGGIIADLFPIHQRGRANAVFSLGPLFGPVVGPTIGGFIVGRAGWRWIFYVLLAACSVMTVANFLLNAETNPVVLMRRKTTSLRKRLDGPELQCTYDIGHANTKRVIITCGLLRPLRMLFGSAILLLLALYVSLVFGMMYLIFTTLTTLYQDVYHWPAELCGLAYLGMGIGFLAGLLIVAKTSDATIARLTKANDNIYHPEMRLASSILFAFFVPISFFWYGWTAEKKAHWIVPLIGLIPFAFGMMGIFLPIQTYFIDVGGKYAASAMAGLTAFRCLFGAFIPLAGPYLYAALGLGWGNSLLGFLTLGLIPVPALIFRYGGAIRRRFPLPLD